MSAARRRLVTLATSVELGTHCHPSLFFELRFQPSRAGAKEVPMSDDRSRDTGGTLAFTDFSFYF